LIPKDVQLTMDQRLPGNLDPADWQLAMDVFQAIKEALLDANQREPREVMSYVLDAIRAHSERLFVALVDSGHGLWIIREHGSGGRGRRLAITAAPLFCRSAYYFIRAVAQCRKIPPRRPQLWHMDLDELAQQMHLRPDSMAHLAAHAEFIRRQTEAQLEAVHA